MCAEKISHITHAILGENPFIGPVHRAGYTFGGAYVYVHNVAKALTRHGESTDIVGLHLKSQRYEVFPGVNMELIAVPSVNGFLPDDEEYFTDPVQETVQSSLRKFLCKKNCRPGLLLHAHHWTSVLASREAREADIPVVFTPHISAAVRHEVLGTPCSDVRYRVEAEGLSTANKVIVNTEWERAQLKKIFGNHQTVVISPGVSEKFNLQERLARRAKIRKELCIPDKEIVVTTAGRLDPIKNYANVIRGFDQFLRKNPGFPATLLIFTGNLTQRDAKHYRELGQLISGLDEKVGAKINWQPFSNDPMNIYAASDVFVSLSKHETFGFTVAEAMSCGLPVIVSDIPPLLEVTNLKPKNIYVSSLQDDPVDNFAETLANTLSLEERIIQGRLMQARSKLYQWNRYSNLKTKCRFCWD